MTKRKSAGPPRPASPARAKAVEILREVLERNGRATPLLSERSGRLNAADHDLLRQLVLGVLRNRESLDAEIGRASRIPLARLAPPLREVLEVALYQLRHLDRVPAYAAVDDAVRQARASGGEGASRLVNAVLRNLQRAGPSGDAGPPGRIAPEAETLSRQFSHPQFLVERWLARFGTTRTLEVLAADNTPSGLDILVNPRRASPESLAAALREAEIETRPSPISPLGLTVISGNPVRSPLLAAGHFTIQDVASQALSLLLPPASTLVDLAAAPGGKTFAALAYGRAERVISLDRSPVRLRRLMAARTRLDFPEALPVAGDVRFPPLAPGGSESVLLDAPCSGTGTLRKNPEIRYRVTEAAIDRLARAQEQSLVAAAELLAPGGYLLYSTCSLEREENEDVVVRLLERTPELARAPIDAPAFLAPWVSGDFFRILPGPDNDGFTAHLLRRRQ